MSKAIASGKAILIGSLLSNALSVSSSVLLARILIPEDYGYLVFATIIAGFIGQIGGMGYEIYYLQFKGNDEEKGKILAQVFNLRIITNLILSLIQISIGLYYYLMFSSISGFILILMAISLFIEAFNAPQEVLLKSHFEFRKITIGNIIKELIATIVKVLGALMGLGGLVFGIGPLVGSIVRYFYYKKVQKFKHIYFSWDKETVRKVLGFGLHNLLGSIGMYLIQQTDKIFLTMFFPKKVVGQYSFAWSNASMPFNYLVVPQGQLILTYVTKHIPGEKSLFYKLLTIQRMIGLLMYPILLLVMIYTKEIVVFIFTMKWYDSINLIKLLIFYYSYNVITSPYMSVLTGFGFAKLNTRLVLSRAFVLIPILFVVGFYTKNIYFYLITFISITILFDTIKILFSINKIGITFYHFFLSTKVDILIVGLYFGVFYVVKFIPTFSKLQIFIPSFVLLIIFLFFIDFKRTKEALLFIKNIIKI